MGNIGEAETLKLKLEQSQRERRNQMEEEERPHVPKWFVRQNEESGNETWIFNDRYWELRKNSQEFSQMVLDRLW
ncbi:Oxysterol-binding protein [Caligus rogercresseyi]|uniref:Oxysterol-binding protein n=1 Tax=Caligus rogercresseyi TaxID=217165 RepID=A0A7T8QUY2_CALRO|nr:Oxysterol-binding protein [Caligus rogercresseyi]